MYQLKKTLMATALLSVFAGAAYADETSVTLYGTVDMAVGYTKVSGSPSKIGMFNGNVYGPTSTKFGLKGSEDLGDGLSAIFRLEAGVNGNDGTLGYDGGLFNRYSYVGLSSKDWGTLTFGKQGGVFDNSLSVMASPFDVSYGPAGIYGMSDVGADSVWPVNNMVTYVSPDFGGFTAELDYSFDTGDYVVPFGAGNGGFGTSDKTRLFSAGLVYANGPLNAGIAYTQYNVPNGVLSADVTPRIYSIAASYDFDVATVYAGFNFATDGYVYQQWADGTDMQDGENLKGFSLGVSVPLSGSTTVKAAYQLADSNADGKKLMNRFSLGLDYAFSKRTKVYLVGTYGTHSTDAYYTGGNETHRSVVVGIDHSF